MILEWTWYFKLPLFHIAVEKVTSHRSLFLRCNSPFPQSILKMWKWNLLITVENSLSIHCDFSNPNHEWLLHLLGIESVAGAPYSPNSTALSMTGQQKNKRASTPRWNSSAKGCAAFMVVQINLYFIHGSFPSPGPTATKALLQRQHTGTTLRTKLSRCVAAAASSSVSDWYLLLPPPGAFVFPYLWRESWFYSPGPEQGKRAEINQV